MSKKADRITPRDENYSRWYHDVIRQGSLAEAAEVVKGCMVIKPHGFAIWEKIQRALDDKFKETGHQNAYFPLLIPESFIKKEAEHVEGFAPELAVVTHAGGAKLEEPYVIRPTSETIIGHYFSKWIDSYRELPLLINQWANVIRWELRTRMFLRTSEFLWQEGHTAHANHQEAKEEVLRMLDIYASFARDWMAMPVIKGLKTESEKFAGALESYCIEAMMQDGKALQAGTSHDLGQNFGKAFDVTFQNQRGEIDYVWQTSWGVSTRLIGGLIMTHSDDNGLVLPPKLAPIQVVIVPIFGKNANVDAVRAAGEKIERELKDQQIATVFDVRDYKPGFKYFEWEQKGVPIRVEIGQRDIDKNQVMIKKRNATEKRSVSFTGLGEFIRLELKDMQREMLEAAQTRLVENTLSVDSYDDFKDIFADGKSKFALAHWDGSPETEARVKDETKATIRCIPLEGESTSGNCIVTGKASKQRVIFARSY